MADPQQTNTDPIIQGLTKAIVDQFGLQDVYQAYLDRNFSKAEQLWLTSDTYKNIGPNRIKNAELKVSQPGVYEQSIQNDWMPYLRNVVTQEGLKVSDSALHEVSDKALQMGLTPTSPAVSAMLKASIDEKGNVVPSQYVTGIFGGAAATTQQNLNKAIFDYGVNFNSDWVSKASQSVASGGSTEQYWLDEIKKQALGAYPALTQQINAGLTVKDAASPYVNTMANILGIDANTINMNDTLLKKALQGTGATTGTSTEPTGQAMPLWQFEQLVRNDSRWATSKDAMDTLSNAGTTLLRQWGLMS